ncbi:MAG: glycoside hydrolase [Thaumarchaeota archaeon]|nr:glycoside hydrolase [Nitrososphaerota archaeon]
MKNKLFVLASSSIVFLFLSMNFASVYASSVVFSLPFNLSNDSFVAKDPNVQNSGSHVYVEASHNSGVSFTPTFNVSSTITNSWAPMVNVWGNLMYVAWRSNPGSSNSQEYVAVSTNAGTSWGSPIAIGVSGRDNQWPFTVAISGNNTFIMWSEKVKTTTTNWQTLVSYSSNNGSTWTLLPSLSTNPSAGAQPENDIATSSIAAFSSHGFAAWQNNATISQIEFASS